LLAWIFMLIVIGVAAVGIAIGGLSLLTDRRHRHA
jgi:hypothetical protein